MKQYNFFYIIIISLFFIPFNTIAGLKFNSQYYSSTEIKNIIEDLGDPDTSDNL